MIPRIFLIFAAAISIAQAPPSTTDKAPTSASKQTAERKPQVIIASVYLPSAISEADVERYADWLSLAKAQHIFFLHLHGKYVERDQQVKEKYFNPLFQHAETMAQLKIHGDPDAAEAYAQFIDERTRTSEAIAANEHQLFHDLEMFLADVQQPQLQQVRNHRIRLHCRSFPFEYPGSRIDLTDLLHELRRAHDFIPNDPELFSRFMAEYDARSTALFQQYAISRLRGIRETPRILAEAAVSVPASHDSDAQEAYRARNRAATDEMLRLARSGDSIGKAIHDLNSRYVEFFKTTLSEEVGNELEEMFCRSAYPAAYPNPFDIDGLLDLGVRIDSLSEDQLTALNAIAADYRVKSRSRSKQMVDRIISFREEFLTTRVNDKTSFERYKYDLSGLQDGRRLATESTMAKLRELLNPDQWKQIESAVAQFEKKVSAHRSRTSGIDYYP